MKKHLVAKFVFAVSVFLLAFFIYQHQTGGQSPQSKFNLKAAENPSFLSAMIEYPKFWPPVYPTGLWIFAHLGVPVKYFNLLCFYLLLISVWFFFRHYVPNIPPACPMILLTLTHSNYVNMYQQVSESLFALLGFVCLLLLARCRNTPTIFQTLLLGVVSSVATLTRFFGLFWVVPITTAYLWFASVGKSPRESVVRLTAYLSPLAVSVIPWILGVKLLTGYVSGMDRFVTREFSKEFTGFFISAKFVVKTALVDFFSFSRSATHVVINDDSVLPIECIAFLFVLLLTILLAFAIAHAYFARVYSQKIDARNLLLSAKALPVHFAIVYILSLIILWSFTNTDPIYTRYMYPSYVFVITAVFSLYSWIKNLDTPIWHKIPFYLLYTFYILANSLKIMNGLTSR